MCSARRLMMFNICVKFHENMSRGFKVMERKRKLLTDTHTHRKDEHYTPPWHTSYAGGIIIIMLTFSFAVLHLQNYLHIFVKSKFVYDFSFACLEIGNLSSLEQVLAFPVI